MRAALALVVLGACRAADAPTAPAHWSYDVVVSDDAEWLTIDASVGGDARALVVDADTAPFVRDLQTTDRVRYRFALGEAARALRDADNAVDFDGAIVSPLSSWLMHPRGAIAASYRVRVRGGAPFLSGVPRAANGADGTFEAAAAGLDESPYFAFGRWRRHITTVAGEEITIGVAPAVPVDDVEIVRIVSDASAALARYLGGFVRPSALVLVVPADGATVDGSTLGRGGASVLLRIGRSATPALVRESWVVTHELVHMNLPSFGYPHAWLDEGIATYVEPIARARAGALPVERVWRELFERASQGLPQAGDEGLEKTHTWARTYWGGALYCLAADVEIRKRTGNARSFDDVLRAIVATGASAAQRWTTDELFVIAERATGIKVLAELFARLALAPGKVELDAMWRDLGVAASKDGVAFDDRAPFAAIRRAITAP